MNPSRTQSVALGEDERRVQIVPLSVHFKPVNCRLATHTSRDLKRDANRNMGII